MDPIICRAKPSRSFGRYIISGVDGSKPTVEIPLTHWQSAKLIDMVRRADKERFTLKITIEIESD